MASIILPHRVVAGWDLPEAVIGAGFGAAVSMAPF
jgi:hypothetical protein